MDYAEKDPPAAVYGLPGTEGGVQVDFSGKVNGRGAYLCPNPECLRKAQRIKSLERSLEIAIPEEVYTRLEKEIERG